MSKRMSRWEKRLLLFLLALFLCLCHFTAANAHYAPPYHINPARVKHITLHRGGEAYEKTISDSKQISEVVRLFNEFKYNERREVPPAAGCGRSVTLAMGFREAGIAFNSDSILVPKKGDAGTVIYTGPPNYFQPLVELADGKTQSLTE